MKRLTSFLVLTFCSMSVFAGSAIVSWTNPTTNTDGTFIPTTGPGSLVSTRVRWGTCISGNIFGTQQGQVVANAPASSVEISMLPSGTYCFDAFSLNTYGVESVASNVASKVVEDPNNAPVLTNPGGRTSIRGVATTLQLVATDVDSDALTYSAVGMPPGITINSAGLFSGIPTTVGAYSVIATVTDVHGDSDSEVFTWTINNPPTPNPPTITVQTYAYELNSRKLGRIVASIPLGVACYEGAILSKNGLTYYQVPASAVTVTSKVRSNVFMAACA